MAGILVFLQCPIVWTEDQTLSLASYFFSISKTPSIKLVTLFCDTAPALIDKLPRNIQVKLLPRLVKPQKIFESVLSLCSTSSELGVQILPIDLVLIVPELNELVVPEAIQCSALANRACDYAFLREKLDSMTLCKVDFLEARHWMLGQVVSNSKSLMTKLSVLQQDKDEFLDQDDDVTFDTLAILKRRMFALPIPSLTCSLPLGSGGATPIVPWKQVYDLIKNAML